MKTLQKLIANLSRVRHMSRAWRYTLIAMACVVIFATTYALILPAITVDQETAEADPAIVLEEGEAEEVLEGALETSLPETVQEETAATEIVESEVVESEVIESEEIESENVESENAESETVESEVVESEIAGSETEEDPSYIASAGVLRFEGDDYEIVVSYDEDAGLPADAELLVTEICDGGSDEMQAVYDAYYEKSLAEVKKNGGDDVDIAFARYFDISIMHDGEKLEPAADVDVKISYKKNAPEVAEQGEVQVVHFEADEEHQIAAEDVQKVVPDEEVEAKTLTEQKDEVKVTTNDTALDEVTFKTDGFSVYGVVGTELIKEITLTTPDDEDVTYVVSVSYGQDAQIPVGAYLEVTEYDSDSVEYEDAWNAVVTAKKDAHEKFDEASFGFSALDISIKDEYGNNVEPAEGTEVAVRIQMKNISDDTEKEALSNSMEVQHLSGGEVKTVADPSDVTVEEDCVVADFSVDSFSTYTITWSITGGDISTANASFRLRFQGPNRYTNNAYMANVRVWYVDENGNNLQKPNGRNDIIYNANNSQNYTVDLNDFTTLNGYSFVEARYSQNNNNKPNGEVIDSVQFVRTGTIRTNYMYYSYFKNGDDTLATLNRDTGTNNDTANIYLVFKNNNARVITVHYGYMNGDQFVEFDSLPEGAQEEYGPPSMMGDQLNIRYDIPEKDYVTTRMGDPSTGTQISPLLQTENRDDYNTYPYWKYRVLDSLTVNNGINEWQRFTSNQDLYVIYRDTPTEKSYDDQGLDPEDLSAPATNKDVHDNGNGTYDLSLSVTGQSNSLTNRTHANVVIMLDTSSSMTTLDNGTRLPAAKNAINFLADELFGFNTADDPETIEIAFVTFSHRVRNEMTKDTIYSGVKGGTDHTQLLSLIEGLGTNGGTNYDTAIEAANSILWNDADPVYVIFVTDGDTVSRGYLEYDASGARDHASDWDSGTYYNADTATYGDSYLERARSAAKLQVDKILSDPNNKFYSIGVFGNVQYLPELGGTYLGQANEQAKIEEAFEKIIDEIALNLGYKDVTIHDGITAMTATTLVNGTVDQYRYEITQKDGTIKKYANGAALQEDYPGIGLAEYDSDAKAVKWELGDDYQLSDGVTYKVIFTVWPSQDAYDLLAELNNGTKDYDSLASDVKKQIIIVDGKYYLKTNTYSTIDYTSIKTENGVVVDTNTVEGAEIKDPNGKMILDGTVLEMEKLWNDDLDPDQLLELLTNNLNDDKTDTTYEVVLRLWQDMDTASEKEIATSEYPSPDGFIYKPIVTISDGQVTAATWPVIDVAIAPGVLVKITEENDSIYDASKYPRISYGSNVTYALLETGHNYNITEDNTDLHFELNTEVYHPMVVDGVLKEVKFSSDGKTITEMSPDNTELSTLTAINTLKGGLEIHKNVTTKDDKSDEVTTDTSFFTFNIKLQKSETDATPVYTTPDQFNQDGSTISGSLGYRIFASVIIPDEATNVADDKSSYEYDGKTFRANKDGSGNITGYTARGTIPSSGELILKIRQSDRIRIVNIPAGTYYTVEEDENEIPNGYELLDKSNENGTVPANTQALAEFWNKRTAFTVDLLKVDETDPNTKLADAEFELFMEDGETPATDTEGNSIGSIKTGPDGKANIGKLMPGVYKLVEVVPPKGYNLMTTPVIISVLAEKVTYQQGSKQPVDAEKSTDGLTWTITATNTSGYELPHTGGTGTLPYTLSGLALILASALMYGFRMRRRERRVK